jgi:hypothetical protein
MSVIKTNFPSWKIVVISDNTDFETFYGQKANSKKEITGGADILYIYEFEAAASATSPKAATATSGKPSAASAVASKPPSVKKEKYIYTW